MILSRRSFLKLAGLTTVAAASASMFTGCGSLKPVTIVYIYEGTDNDIKTKVENLNKDVHPVHVQHRLRKGLC